MFSLQLHILHNILLIPSFFTALYISVELFYKIIVVQSLTNASLNKKGSIEINASATVAPTILWTIFYGLSLIK